MQIQTEIDQGNKHNPPREPDGGRGIEARNDSDNDHSNGGYSGKYANDLLQVDLWFHGFCVGLGVGLILAWFLR